MNKLIRFVSLVLLITLITACAPSTNNATDSPDAVSTQVEQTVQARLTAESLLNAATLPASVPPTDTITAEAPTAFPAAGFAVTDVSYTVSTWSDTVNGKQYTNCPLITANITANGAGTVEYHWVALDSTRPALTSQLENGVLTFDTAGTQTVTQRVMYRESSGGQGMMYLGDSGGVTIDAPNPQAFGGVFLPVCAAP